MKLNDRWWYLIILSAAFISASYTWLIHPMLNHLDKLKKEERQLNQTALNLERQLSYQTPTISIKPHSPLDEIDVLTAQSHLHNVVIQSMTYRDHARQTSESKLMHLQLQGDATSLWSFLLDLTNITHQNVMFNFAWQATKKNQQQLSMDLLPQADPWQSTTKEPPHSPFCSINQASIFQAPPETEQTTIPLMHMKMIGYIQQEQHYQVMIALSTHHVITLQEGDHIGTEQGTIKAISPENITIMLPNQKQIMMQLRNK